MPRLMCLVIICISITYPFANSRAEGVVGTWATVDGNSHVEIVDCSGKLCGTITWLKEPLDKKGAPKNDLNNPIESLKSRPILGLALLTDFVPTEDPNVWENGKIYNPVDGKTYSCTLTLLDEITLKVRGYIGLPMFGKTQIWTRAD